MSNEQTRLSIYIKKLQDHPVISLIIFVCICLMAVSAFITQIDSGYSTISKRVSQPAETKEPSPPSGKETFSKPSGIDEQKSEQTSDCNNCNEIYTRGVELTAQGRISKPPGSNAYEHYLELKQRGSTQAEKLLETMISRLRQLTQSAIKSGDISSATRHLNTLKSIDSNHDTTDLSISIRTKHDELTKQLQPEPNPARKIKQENQSIETKSTPDKDIKPQPNPETNNPPTSTTQTPPPTNPTNTIEIETNTSNDKHLNEWISAVCASVNATYGDNAKVRILQTAINDEPSITGTTLYKLYSCADIYSDSYKVDAIQIMAKKMTRRSLLPTHYSRIINDMYADSYKSSAAGILIPYINKDHNK